MPKKPKSRLLRKEARAAYIYLIPAFIGLIVLTYVPLVAVFGLSFFKWGGTGVPEWVGLGTESINLIFAWYIGSYAQMEELLASTAMSISTFLMAIRMRTTSS